MCSAAALRRDGRIAHALIADLIEAVATAMIGKMERPEVLNSSIKQASESRAGERLLTPHETAEFLRVSISWLAKARMRGDGPPFVKIGRGVFYRESAILQWLKSKERLSVA